MVGRNNLLKRRGVVTKPVRQSGDKSKKYLGIHSIRQKSDRLPTSMNNIGAGTPHWGIEEAGKSRTSCFPGKKKAATYTVKRAKICLFVVRGQRK